jgi:hypothetical protein
MTTETFYETLKSIVEFDVDLRLQTGLETIRDTLNNLVSSPANPQHQSALASALANFTAAAERLAQTLTPNISSSIAAVGGGDFFNPTIAEEVKDSIAANAMTPTVARDFVQDLATRRASFLKTVKQTLEGLKDLGITSAGLQPGSADLSFAIPRDLFKNELAAFAKELTFISRLIEHFSEAITGETEPVELETLSSSTPTVAILASVSVIAVIADVVNRFLDAWEKVEKIRKVRAELTDLGMKGKAIEELTDRITTTIQEVVEESTQLTFTSYKGDPARKNELETAIKQDTHRLFAQIERGLTIQFRAEPKDAANEADKKALEAVERLGRELQFPKAEVEPMLLESGKILEGDIPQSVTFSSKTTTHRTTTKKQTKKEAEATS